MKKLIVSGHAIDMARERVSLFDKSSPEEKIRGWYEENVLSAEKIPWGSKLYLRLEKGKKESDRKFVYFKDDVGIYVVEVIDEQRGFLRTVRELGDFGETPKPKLKEYFLGEQFSALMSLRENLPQRSA